jgi:hypothetical protein
VTADCDSASRGLREDVESLRAAKTGICKTNRYFSTRAECSIQLKRLSANRRQKKKSENQAMQTKANGFFVKVKHGKIRICPPTLAHLAIQDKRNADAN